MRFITCFIFISLLMGSVAVQGEPRSLVEAPTLEPLPLRVGEKLTYDIHWKNIKAAERTDWIVKEETVNGQPVYHIQSAMKTRRLFRVYSFQRQEETYLDPITLSPVRFRNELKDRDYRATVTVDFGDGTAEYEKRSRPDSKAPERQETHVLEIPAGTQDELSTLYFLRTKALTLGETYFFPIIAKGKVQKVTLTVERVEILKNKKLGVVRTLVLESSTGDRFWFTDDERRILVKAESKIGRLTVSATLSDMTFTNPDAE